jgi:pyruvate dehydrogenase E1 component alpha subunit
MVIRYLPRGPELPKKIRKPAADESGSDENFALRSLQTAHTAQPRYAASDAELLSLYEQMLLIRRFEERAGQLYGLGLIGGFCHLYIGQEAVAVGLQSALDPARDSVITGYRDHGHMLAYGIDPKLIMAELTGRAAGISRGKGGSMHMFSVDHRFYGAGFAGHWPRICPQVSRRRRGLHCLFRRRRRQSRPGL